MIRKFCANAALVVVSLVVSVAVAEVVLRVAVSRYEYAADADYQENALRIWKRQPNIDKVRQHPDTGSRHALHHNNLALRHDRDIAAHELTERINIGVFGDSFTENVRLPAAQGFVDIADYLLNLESSGYNVLNFGVDGYGADQEYLYYKEFSSAHRLDHVLYVLCANDLGDIVYNNLFSLDASGRLIRNPARALSPLTSLASRFHVTYLLYDAYLKFKGKDEPATERLIRRQNNAMRKAAKVRMTKPLSTLVDGSIALSDKAQSGSPGFGEARGALPLLLAILEAWQRDVALAGGEFTIVLLPTGEEQQLAPVLKDAGYSVLDLYNAFAALMPDYRYELIRFDNDGHWGEEGNLMAGWSLYRFVEEKHLLGKQSDRDLKMALYRYYEALDGDWRPGARWAVASANVPGEAQAIRRRYAGLRADRE